ncbi:hypothetical protein [Paraburkholderia sp. J10-1]|uniref:hypothetical protein n=1 Tax=Paraburkholderia sp. J10-1 TaxID=2805430 RepID=UPI002AB737D8|nr:hypothetical protein [Paraburkholderia sp. J10-1]
MHSLMEKLKEEFKKVLPPTIFFFVILHIIALVRTLMVKETGITLPASGSVLIASLILGKSVLLADMLPFINRFPDKPLVWNVAWKTLMYTIVALVIHYLERLYEFWKEAGSFAGANHEMFLQISWPRFWAIQILLVTLVFNYCVIAELGRALGKSRLKRMFFGPLPVSPGRS